MLAKLQQQFIDGIYRNDNTLLQHIDDHIRPANLQLDLYRNSVFGGLLKAITEIYPVCKKLVGDEFFDAMCLRYIKQTPSCHFDINSYGNNFPDFIEHFPPAKSLAYLPDVCRLEWFWHCAYQADEVNTPSLTKLLSLEPSVLLDCRLTLHPTANLLQSQYPVDAIWNMNQSTNNSEENLLLEDKPDNYFFIWRQDINMRIDKLDRNLFTFLKAIKKRKTIGELVNTFPATNSLLIHSFSLGYFHSYEVC